MQVLTFDILNNNESDLPELIRQADCITLHIPKIDENEAFFNREKLAAMKDGAILVNTARGSIVDEDALTEALQSGDIAGAGIDAFQNEPLDNKSPLWDMDNVFISPHASALTSEMFRGRQLIFKENLRRFISKEPFLYVCDKKAGF